jgi:hypothetical protein
MLSQVYAQGSVYPDLIVSVPNIQFPANFSAFTPPVDPGLAVSDAAPQIAEWTRQNGPGDTMALTAEALNVSVGFKVYGPSVTADATIQYLDGRQCAITFPGNLPPSEMYLLWPKNDQGYGEPVTINQAELWWIGPDRVSAGQMFSVYGRNLSLGGESCWAYIDDGENGQWIESSNANPYKADFICPDNIPNGPCTIYVHNGHGGKYGWSDMGAMTVQDPIVWSGPTFNVKDFGAKGDGQTDDFPAIQAAYNQAKQADFSTVYFPAGTYMVSSTIYPNAGRLRYKGAGMDSTIVQAFGDNVFNQDKKTVFILRNESAIEDMEVNKGDMHGSTVSAQGGVSGGVKHIRLERVRISGLSRGENADTFGNYTLNIKSISEYALIKDCVIIGGGSSILAGGGRQIFFDGCEMIGIDDANALMSSTQSEFSMVNCYAHPYDTSDDTDRLGWCKGRWIHGGGPVANYYIGDCVSQNMGPRYPSSEVQGTIVEVVNNTEPNSISRVRVTEDLSSIYFGDWPEGARLEYIGVGHGKNDAGRGYKITAIDYATGWIDIKRDWNTSDFRVGDSYEVREVVDQNAGEQFMWEWTSTRYAGLPSDIIDNKTFILNPVNYDLQSGEGLVGMLLVVVDGVGMGQSAVVVSADLNTGRITLDKPLRVKPDSLSSVFHIGEYMHQMTFYNNNLNGYARLIQESANTATAGFNAYGGCVHSVFASNTVKNVESGFDLMARSGRNSMEPIFFNIAEDNQFHALKYGVRLSAFRKNGPEVDMTPTLMGTVIRDNTFSDITDLVISMGDAGGTRRIDMNLFDNNTSLNNAQLVSASSDIMSRQVWMNWQTSAEPQTFTVSYSDGANGSLSGNVSQVVQSGGSSTPVEAVADAGYRFVQWTGSLSSTQNPLVLFNVLSDYSLTPQFEPDVPLQTFSVSYAAGPNGSLSGNVFQSVTEGSSASAVEAIADEGYHFARWTGDILSTQNPLVISDVSSDLVLTAVFAENGSSGITREVWFGISGGNVDSLTGDIRYPDAPDVREVLSSFEAPSNYADNFGTRMHGYVVPPVTGDYTFWIAGDDDCELWLSSDDSESNASQVASVPGWTNDREWDKYQSQKSSTVTMQAGQRYYIMALHKEGSLGDGLGVAWEGPGITRSVMGSDALEPYQPSVPAVTLTELTILGAVSMDEQTSGQYSCIASYSDGSTQIVSPAWGIGSGSSFASINSSGSLSAGNVDADQNVVITATYGGVSDSHAVTIRYVVPTVTGLAISGPSVIDEVTDAQLSCMATYSDGSSTSVSPTWSVDSPVTSISPSGLLQAGDVAVDENVVVTALFDGQTATSQVRIRVAENQVIYPLSGFEGRTVRAELWDHANEESRQLGEMENPNELIIENLNSNLWYWLSIQEYDPDIGDWVPVQENWINM